MRKRSAHCLAARGVTGLASFNRAHRSICTQGETSLYVTTGRPRPAPGHNGDVSAATRPRRADAREKKERILAAAVSTLSADPHASLERVAQVAGVHRATVYRHFPSRDHLIQEVLSHALCEGIEVVTRAAQREPSVEAVYRLAADTARFGSQYAFLVGTAELAATGPDPIGLSALMANWQSSRLLRSDTSAEWLAAAFIALAKALLTPGAIANEQEPHKVLADMFLRGAACE
jgi:AcrR family transcriptional regulator